MIAAGLIMRVEDLPAGLARPGQLADKPAHLLLCGGSTVIGPDGQYVSEPCFDKEEIILAQLDLHAIDKEKMTLDVTGHYHRPDLFAFRVNTGHRASDMAASED